MSKYFEALDEYDKQDGDKSIFLAGGIVGVSYNWQREMAERLSDSNLIVLNPRRVFPEGDPYATTKQIKWEFDHLRKADMILFWFAKEGLCQTSFYELGAWSMTDKPLFIGIEPGYVKRGGVEKQTKLARPDVPIVYSLDDLELLVKGSI